MQNLKQRIDAILETVIRHRRWLHAHPEPSGQEKNTASYIAAALREIGLQPTENVGGYGVVAVINGRKDGRCVGLRADFDALSIQEKTGLPFASKNPGISHACGHDVHTAMLLGVAEVLNGMKEEFAGSVKLIFRLASITSRFTTIILPSLYGQIVLFTEHCRLENQMGQSCRAYRYGKPNDIEKQCKKKHGS